MLMDCAIDYHHVIDCAIVIMSKRKSPVWSYIAATDGGKFVTCQICTEKVSRGGESAKTFTPTNLIKHLKKHPEQYKEYEARKAAATENTPSSSRQFTLVKMIDRTRKWETSDPRSVRISTRIGKMIAHDCQPFSIVDNEGFGQLVKALEPRYPLPSRRYMSEKICLRNLGLM